MLCQKANTIYEHSRYKITVEITVIDTQKIHLLVRFFPDGVKGSYKLYLKYSLQTNVMLMIQDLSQKLGNLDSLIR